MLYIAYHCYTDLIDPLRAVARGAQAAYAPVREIWDAKIGRRVSAAWELIARAGLSHERPALRHRPRHCRQPGGGGTGGAGAHHTVRHPAAFP